MRILPALLLTLAVLALPAVAVGQPTPQQDVYGADDVKSVPDEEPRNLPFTGLEVAIVILAGATLVGTGFAVRRAGRSDRPS